jgi:starch phosphorylase
VSLQLYAGPVSASGRIENPQIIRMDHGKEMGQGVHVFTGRIDCRASGRHGFAVRVLPGNPDMATPFEPGLIAWN